MGMHAGSINSRLAEMEVGERWYIETTATTYEGTMRLHNPPQSRRGPELKKRKFKCNLFTVVSNQKKDRMRLLVCVERTK